MACILTAQHAWQPDRSCCCCNVCGQGHDLLKLLLAIEPVVILNAALCERHLQHCPPSTQLASRCAQVPLQALPPMPTQALLSAPATELP